MSLFDKSTILEDIKLPMSPTDKARSADILRALILCLSDLSSRLNDKGLATSKTVSSVAAATRTLTLTGSNQDLNYIFAIKYGSDETIIEYVDTLYFIKNYDSPTATAGTPKYFSILVSDQGFPVVKFDKPTAEVADLILYFFPFLTPDNVVLARNAANAIVLGSQAIFYGTGEGKGLNLWEQYKDAVQLVRSSNNPVINKNAAFVPNKLDRSTNANRWSERLKRA